MKRLLRHVALAAALASLSATPLSAAIVTATPAVIQIAPPPSTLPGALQSNTDIFAFNELQDVAVPGTIPVDISVAGTYNTAASLTPGAIPTGTVVDVHLLHFDQLGPGTTSLTGSIRFDADIIGVQVLSATLNTADVLGTAGAYPTGDAFRGVEWVGEQITVLPNLRDLRLTLITSNIIDQVRVFTRGNGDPGQPTPYLWEFSLDIGSDKELSDPQADGDEGFDPGDVYFSTEGPVTPPVVPCGRDASIKDDAILFPVDPFPDAPDCGGLTGAPVGSQCPVQDCFFNYFDLDGHDQIDIDLRQFINPDGPNPQPLPYGLLSPDGESNCIFEVKHVFLSRDDDRSPNWSFGDVPTTSSSPAGVSSYGTTAARDEVIGWELIPAGGFYLIASEYPVADERTIHPDLAPNPDNGDTDDDDVDSLDIVRNDNPDEPDGPIELCPFWVFTADHEAPSFVPLDPGGVYLKEVFAAGAPVKIIDEAIHLGIPETTDIDAIEFGWLPHQETGGLVLALLFSVDNDDPFTPGDESGGLDPKMVYASYLTGFSFPLIDPSEPELRDDIDAITIWREPLQGEPATCRCPADMNGDSLRDGLDIQGFMNCVLGAAAPACVCGDLNGDNVTDLGDLADFVAVILSKAPCP